MNLKMTDRSGKRAAALIAAAMLAMPLGAFAQNQPAPAQTPAPVTKKPELKTIPITPGVTRVEKETKRQQPTAPGNMTPADAQRLNPGAAVQPAPAPGHPNAVGQPPVAAVSAVDALQINDPKFDWGDISDTEPVEHIFTFKNISDKTITLAVSASCGCTVPALEKTTYTPGEEGKVSARFDPHGRTGAQTKTLTFTITNPQGMFNQQTTTLTANVKALVLLDPPKMYLNEVDHREGQVAKVTVTGRKADFKVTKVEPSSEFVVATIGEPSSMDSNGEKLVQVPIELRVGKGAPIGNFQSTLSITTNDERAKLSPMYLGADVVGDIKATPAQAILRVSTPSTPFTTQVRLDSRSGTAFNILSIDVEGRANMQAVADAQKSEDGKYFMITLSGTTPAEGGLVQGNIVLSTDAQGGETMKIPFTAVVRKPDAAQLPPAAR